MVPVLRSGGVNSPAWRIGRCFVTGATPPASAWSTLPGSEQVAACGGLPSGHLLGILRTVNTPAHPELISDDPRLSLPHVEDVQKLREASALHGTLITTGQAARILECSTAQLGVWVQRGKFTRLDALGGVMVPLAEVVAYRDLRDSGGSMGGGRGHRGLSGPALLRAS